MTMLCERCKREIYRNNKCNYCDRAVCDGCMKASQRASKLQRLIICRDCWSNMEKRTLYKNKREAVQGQARA